jgi:hypothetical protein
MFRSVGILKKTPGLLNTLRKEGFARVHRQRKGDALRLPGRLREKPSKRSAERKECAKDTVSSSYKLRRKSAKLSRGQEKVH